MSNFYGELLIRITSDTAGLSKGLQKSVAETGAASKAMESAGHKASRSWERVGLGMQNVGRTMSQFVTIPIAAGFAFAAYSGYKYSKALLQIRNLTGLTADETERYGSAMLDMSKYGIGPQKLAEAMYFISSSGFKAAEALKVLDVAAKASASGMGEIQPVADVLTSAMNAYGHANLSAARATDILMKTIQVGKAEPEALATSLGRIMPVAAKLGVPLGQVGGAIAGLTLTGLSAAEAVTSLRGTMIALAAPAKMSIEELGRLGLSYQQVTRSIKDKGLLATMQMLYEKTDGNMLAMRKIIPNVRALNGVLSLLGANYQSNLKVIDKVANAHGALDRAMKNTAQQPVQKLRQAWASLQASFIKVGAVVLPFFARIAAWLAKVADSLASMSPGWRNFILIMAAVAAAVGPVVMILGTFINAIGLIRGVLPGLMIVKSLGALFSGFQAGGAASGVMAFTAALGPLRLALLGVAVAAAAFYGFVKVSDWLDGTTERIGAMRKAAEAAAADDSLKQWADKFLGGHLEAVGKNDFVFKAAVEIDTPTDLIKNWVATAAAQAKAAANEGKQQSMIDQALGQKADWEQRIHEIESMPALSRNIGGANEKIMADRNAEIAALKQNLLGLQPLLGSLGIQMADLKVHDQAMVFKANMTDIKTKVKDVNQQLQGLKGKPHTIKLILREMALRDRLSALKNQLSKVAGKSYQVRLHVRIETLETKIDQAKRRLAELVGTGTGAGGKRKYSPEVSADIRKITRFLKKAEAQSAAMKTKVEAAKPTIDMNADSALDKLAAVTQAMDGINGRDVTGTVNIIVNQIPGSDGKGGHRGGIFSGPHSGYPMTLHGREVVLPLEHPNLIPGLLQRAGVTKLIQPEAVPLQSTRGAASVQRPLAATGTDGSPAVTELHYHSHVYVPGGTTIVGSAEQVATTLAPHIERSLAKIHSRRGRGR